jgi:hypothetical protein
MVMAQYFLETITITTLSLAIALMNERDRRRAHLQAGGTIENYDRSHYPQWYKDKLEKEKNESKNNLNARKH